MFVFPVKMFLFIDVMVPKLPFVTVAFSSLIRLITLQPSFSRSLLKHPASDIDTFPSSAASKILPMH